MELPFAEDIKHYWKTSRSSSDTWLDRASMLIEGLGGEVWTVASGKDDKGHLAFVMQFEIGPDQFKIFWPVLPSKTGDNAAAKRQAATLLYHDIKAKCMTALVLGTRAAFFQFLMLPDGRTTITASIPELMEEIPQALTGHSQPQISHKKH